MTTAEFLTYLRNLGAELRVDGDRLNCTIPKALLTPDLSKELKERKTEILLFLETAGASARPLERRLQPIPRDGSLPLSFAQQRLWFLEQFEPERPLYNIPYSLRLTGRLDIAGLERSLNEIVRRHESLRTTFSVMDGQPVQVIAPVVSLTLPVHDLRTVPDREDEALRRAIEEARRPFDLAQAPLLRAHVLRLAEEEHILLLTLHHIVSDAWSMGVLLGEISAVYNAFTEGKPCPLSELPIQYVDFAVWQRQWLTGETLDKQLAYWKKQLAGAPATLELPTDRPRPAIQTFHGARQSVEFSQLLTHRLKALSNQTNVTLFVTLLAAFQILLNRYTGQDDILIGSPIAGRNRTEIEGLIGLFINTLVLRTDLSGNPSFRELISRARDVALEAYAHQDLPFEKLVEELQPDRSLSHSPLFQVMFILHNNPVPDLKLNGLSVNFFRAEQGTAKFDLTFSFIEKSGSLSGSIEYNTDLYDAATISRMSQHYQILLERVVANPDQRLSDLSLVTDVERQQLLVAWQDTRRPYPNHACIHQLFEAQVETKPDAVAVVDGEDTLTYRQLHQRSNQLARYLRGLGVGPQQPVAVCMGRSAELVVTLLAILKAGGAYVPLDPDYPPPRLRFMLEDTRVAAVVTQRDWNAALTVADTPVVRLEVDGPAIDALSSAALDNLNTPEDLAYVIYTSGSTGRPKGVEVPHRGVIRLLCGVEYAPLDEHQTFLLLAPTSFDASTFELWGPLLHGGTCVVYPHRVPDPHDLERVLTEHRITCLWLTAALFNAVIDQWPQALASVPHLLIGGEALSVHHVRRALELLPQTQIVNGYGPTEGTTFTCTYAIPHHLDPHARSIPIGRPISNTTVYILDRHGHLVPVGVPGELYIAGDGLAHGYLDRSELTAERFVANPFSTRPGARMYKTGDLCRWLPDGNIEFFGRLDEQVKIRGFRIELGEIEAMLGQHPAVQETVVLAREDIASDRRLVAYVVPYRGQQLETHLLRRFLSERLPEYMVPSAFVLVEALPLSPNGKVDRKALPAPDQNRSELEVRYVDPRDAIEVQLTRIWEKVLGRGPIGGRDNFFELGGHSLLAVQVVHQIREVFGQTIPVKALFQAPTVEQLAEVLREEDPLRDWASLVPLQPNGSKPPFFFLAGRSHFGDRLGPDQPVYRVVYQDLDREQPFVRIEDMAAHSIQSVRKIQPRGPYYLGGHGVGGMVAFEMAQQLQRQGQKVALLALCECWTRQSGPPPRGKSKTYRLWQKVAYHFHQTQRVGARQELTDLLVSLKNKTRGSTGRRPNLPLTASQEEAKAALLEGRRQYVPQVYYGRITLIRCSERRAWRDYGPLDGWGNLATDGVEVYEVPGSHSRIYREPNVGMLAKTLSDVLYKAQAEMGGERTAVKPSIAEFDGGSFGDPQSATRTEVQDHRHNSQSFSESLPGS